MANYAVRIALLSFLTACTLTGQVTNDPFPQPIAATEGVITVKFAEFATIPAFNGVTVPATFTDGTLLLSGAFTQFATLFFGGQTGTVTSTINWTGGSKLSDLQALGIASGWHWNPDCAARSCAMSSPCSISP